MKRDDKRKEERRFPLFISLRDRRILVVGGGNIAVRRIGTLLEFGPERIKVVAPDCREEIREWAKEGRIEFYQRPYESGDIEGMFLVLAAANLGEVNRKVHMDCAAEGKLVNVCDDASLCDFHFPGVICREELTIGINASGKNHRKAKKVRERIEKCLEGDFIYE